MLQCFLKALVCLFPRTGRLLPALVLFAMLCSTSIRAEHDTILIVDELSQILLDNSMPGKAMLAQLLAKAEINRNDGEPSSAAWLACARVRLWYADTLGPLAGFKQLRLVRSELEQAIRLDANNGFAVAYLGFLHATLPSWPLSFGDAEQGKALMTQALVLDRNSVGSNFLYALFLFAQSDYRQASKHLLIARANLDKQSMSPNERLMMRNELDELGIKLQSQLPGAEYQ